MVIARREDFNQVNRVNLPQEDLSVQINYHESEVRRLQNILQQYQRQVQPQLQPQPQPLPVFNYPSQYANEFNVQMGEQPRYM